jgi:hypothetical protein
VPTDHPNTDVKNSCDSKNADEREIDEFEEFLRETRDKVSTDDEIAVYVAHPNVQFTRDYEIMRKVHPQCNFMPHPNMSAARMRKFQSCLGCKYNSLKTTGDYRKNRSLT